MNLLEDVAAHLRPRTSVRGRTLDHAALDARMAELYVPSVSVGVLEGGDVLSRAWGASPDTLFQAASISKPVTAIAAVRLGADGVIDLDANVNEQLRTWTLPEGDGVTPRRILSHNAGLGVHGFPGYERGTALPSLVQILDGEPPANTEAVRVVRPPGEAYQYSGGGTTLLQLLIEDVTGEPFAELMRRVVLEPLGMSASTYEQPLPESMHARAATGTHIDGSPVAGDWHVYPEQAPAGLWTTPTDLLRVAEEMIHPGRVLDTALRDEMLTPYSAPNFGIGWALEPPWFQHGGSNAGFQCLLFGSPESERAVAVMTNSDAGATVCFEVVAAAAEVLGWPGFLRERDAVELGDAALDAVTGDYEIEPGAVVHIRRVGDTLTSAVEGLPERELFAASATEFFRTDFDAEIGIVGDELTIIVSGTKITGRRVPPGA